VSCLLNARGVERRNTKNPKGPALSSLPSLSPSSRSRARRADGFPASALRRNHGGELHSLALATSDEPVHAAPASASEAAKPQPVPNPNPNPNPNPGHFFIAVPRRRHAHRHSAGLQLHEADGRWGSAGVCGVQP
jgi:hypothetical protein